MAVFQSVPGRERPGCRYREQRHTRQTVFEVFSNDFFNDKHLEVSSTVHCFARSTVTINRLDVKRHTELRYVDGDRRDEKVGWLSTPVGKVQTVPEHISDLRKNISDNRTRNKHGAGCDPRPKLFPDCQFGALLSLGCCRQKLGRKRNPQGSSRCDAPALITSGQINLRHGHLPLRHNTLPVGTHARAERLWAKRKQQQT